MSIGTSFFFITLSVVFLLHVALLTYGVTELVVSTYNRTILIAIVTLSSLSIACITVINALVFVRFKANKRRSTHYYGIGLAYFVAFLADVLLCAFSVMEKITDIEESGLAYLTICTVAFTFFHFLSVLIDVVLRSCFKTTVTTVYCRWIEKCLMNIISSAIILCMMIGLGYVAYRYITYTL